MPGPLRVVLDTNVLLAGRTSSHPTSPAAEILDHWQRREFVVLYSLDTLAKYAEKLLSRGIAPMDVEAFIRRFVLHAATGPLPPPRDLPVEKIRSWIAEDEAGHRRFLAGEC